MNYYNENNPYAAQWLRNLIGGGLIPAGNVDERDIREVQPSDLKGYTQCHFFAGIAGWSYALELAHWPEDREVWTGSCPCQPFSVAGKKKGKSDERHLWPVWKELIDQCRPSEIFGEQIASPLGREWLSGVRADLEEMGYAVGGADLCAASLNAPHTRQRLWWVAYSRSQRLEEREEQLAREECSSFERGGNVGRVVDPETSIRGRTGSEENVRRRVEKVGGSSSTGGLGNADGQGSGRNSRAVFGEKEEGSSKRQAVRRELDKFELTSFWGDFDIVWCKDGKSRRIESRSHPLAYGVPARVGKLSAYGNAIVPQVAAQFVMAYKEAIKELT